MKEQETKKELSNVVRDIFRVGELFLGYMIDYSEAGNRERALKLIKSTFLENNIIPYHFGIDPSNAPAIIWIGGDKRQLSEAIEYSKKDLIDGADSGDLLALSSLPLEGLRFFLNYLPKTVKYKKQVENKQIPVALLDLVGNVDFRVAQYLNTQRDNIFKSGMNKLIITGPSETLGELTRKAPDYSSFFQEYFLVHKEV